MNQINPSPGPRLSAETLHTSTVALDGRAVLISGPSGSGKSDLALRLLDRGFVLVSDDQTIVRKDGNRLLATAPAAIAGSNAIPVTRSSGSRMRRCAVFTTSSAP